MKTMMPNDTRALLGDDADRCESRSLFKDRFPNPSAKDGRDGNPRREWYQTMIGKKPTPEGANARLKWLLRLGRNSGAKVLYGQLQSRLMVDMGGGVMENANLCIDRYGLPLISGSAVKGCAHRMAMQHLKSMCEDGSDNTDIASSLADIAMVFGWSDTDWCDGRRTARKKESGSFYSDFEWACRSAENPSLNWAEIKIAAANQLLARFPGWQKKDPEKPWMDLPNFGGCVGFLPAYALMSPKSLPPSELPLKMPALGTLELDVLTCHHPDYYKDPSKGDASDTENPNPVVFPAVGSGHVFAFPLMLLRHDASYVEKAGEWLSDGLRILGIGAKTAAGYGWFECLGDLNSPFGRALLKDEADAVAAAKEDLRLAKERELDAIKKAEDDRKKEEDARKKAIIDALPPDQRLDKEFELLDDNQFRGKYDRFTALSSEEQAAVVKALRLPEDQPGSRLNMWISFKKKAEKGGKPARLVEAIRKKSREMFPGKEGRMP